MCRIYFFGAGRKGRYWLSYLKNFGVLPAGFIDNNKDLYGSTYEDLPIYSPDSLKTCAFEFVVITCNDEERIYQQLLELGVEKRKIIVGLHSIRSHLLYYAATAQSAAGRTAAKDENICSHMKILFDLQNGMVLGGVEAWSYELAGQLKMQGFQGMYLTIDTALPVCVDETYPIHAFQYKEYGKDFDRIQQCVHVITQNLPCTIICNFPQYIFWAACTARGMYPDQIRIISVLHNDDQTYYEAYSLWQKYIDKCMVISSRMEEKILSYGMDKKRIGHISWQTTCSADIERTWSKEGDPLRIGYAGRMTVTQKRADLFPVLAAKMKERNLCFHMNLAGVGEYSKTLQRQMEEENLQNEIALVGYLDRQDIPHFWRNQDIMISCSEIEGHSISQSEAMAAGAVPVITDVSGARDDVTDGYNGFVVPVGDMDALVDRICYLYHHRDELERMGKRAHDTIYARQKDRNQAAYWDKLLKEVWES